LANKAITREQAEAAGMVSCLHDERILPPNAQVVINIHGWHGDGRLGKFNIPQAMYDLQLEKNGRPVVGISSDWWGINGNDSKDPRYRNKPLSDKDLGRTVRRFMRMLGVEGNPDMFVLRMGLVPWWDGSGTCINRRNCSSGTNCWTSLVIYRGTIFD
jgi:hypothetical protein